MNIRIMVNQYMRPNDDPVLVVSPAQYERLKEVPGAVVDPDRPVTLSLEHGIVEPTDSKTFSLSDPEDA